jgi:transposase
MAIKVIGLDIAKSVFQVHGVDEAGQVVLRRRLRRAEVLKLFAGIEPALVGIEACHTAHYWAREIAALGHEVRLMPPQFVKPYIKSQKNDAADAEAICEAVQRPTMRFVPVKSAEQQAVLLMHRTRDLLIRQRSSLISATLHTSRNLASLFNVVFGISTGCSYCLAGPGKVYPN